MPIKLVSKANLDILEGFLSELLYEDDERRGLKIGIKQGIEKGIELERLNSEKRLKQEKIEIAKNLLDVLDTETISIKTGLSVEEIEEIKSSFR